MSSWIPPEEGRLPRRRHEPRLRRRTTTSPAAHLLANKLKEAMPGYETPSSAQGWPKDEKVLDGADAIVMYCDGGAGHIALPAHRHARQALRQGRRHRLHPLRRRGARRTKAASTWLKWMGGYFETYWSVNPHWIADFEELPEPPRRQRRQAVQRRTTSGTTTCASATTWRASRRSSRPSRRTSTRQGKDGPHSGNPDVRKGIGKNQTEHVLWVSENDNGTRGFGMHRRPLPPQLGPGRLAQDRPQRRRLDRQGRRPRERRRVQAPDRRRDARQPRRERPARLRQGRDGQAHRGDEQAARAAPPRASTESCATR